MPHNQSPSQGETEDALPSGVTSAFTPVSGGPRRRAGDAADAGPETQLWMVSFTDTMALMLTFFVMMFAMSAPKTETWQEVAASLQQEFKGTPRQDPPRGTEDAPNLERVNFNRALDISYLRALLVSTLSDHAGLGDARLIPQPGGLVLSLPQDLLFESGSATVTEEGRKALYVLGGALSRIRNRIEVAGHADPRPLDQAQSDYQSNWGLSVARAASVAGVLETVGYAKPIAVYGLSSARYDDLSGVDDENLRLDLSRRVDIVIRDHDGAGDWPGY